MERHQAALDLLRRLAEDFNVRDARKLHKLARCEFSKSGPDLRQGPGGAAAGRGPAGAGAEAAEPGQERGRRPTTACRPT